MEELNFTEQEYNNNKAFFASIVFNALNDMIEDNHIADFFEERWDGHTKQLVYKKGSEYIEVRLRDNNDGIEGVYITCFNLDDIYKLRILRNYETLELLKQRPTDIKGLYNLMKSYL